MRIGINARLLNSANIRGWNRYTINLLEELAGQGIDLFLYAQQPLDPFYAKRLRPHRYVVRVSPPMPYFWWEQRWLPRQCAADSVSLLHSPFNFGLPWRSQCPRVLTLHDALHDFQALRAVFHPRELTTWLSHWIARSRADRIIAVTEYASKELINLLGIPTNRISVIPEAADPTFTVRPPDAAIQTVMRKHGLDMPYFFYVGGWEQRKNVPFLIDAFAKSAIADVNLVLAGGLPHQIAELAASAPEGVRLLGWIQDEDLAALYTGALAFVYPSRHEGFGLQICEAMGLSCPVLAARASSLPEVLAHGGETFSLDTHDELIVLLRRVAGDPAFREQLVRRAEARSKELSWRRTSEQTISVYKRVIEEHRSGAKAF